MTEYCKKDVHDWSGVGFHKCSRKAVRDGYCKQHHPDAEKARRKKSDDKWKLESKISDLQSGFRVLGHKCVDFVEVLARSKKNKRAVELVGEMNKIRKEIIKLRAKLEESCPKVN